MTVTMPTMEELMVMGMAIFIRVDRMRRAESGRPGVLLLPLRVETKLKII